MYQLLADTLPNYPYQTSNAGSSGGVEAFIMTFFVVELIALVFYAICLYKVFQKAGKPGWAGIVPIYNSWVLFELTGLPSWMAILLVIPFINIIPVVMSLVAYYRLAGLFGKGSGFGVLMVLLPVIGLPILAFGDARFRGAAGSNAASRGYNPAKS